MYDDPKRERKKLENVQSLTMLASFGECIGFGLRVRGARVYFNATKLIQKKWV